MTDKLWCSRRLLAVLGLVGASACSNGQGANGGGAAGGGTGNGGVSGTPLGLWNGTYRELTQTSTGGTIQSETHDAHAEFISNTTDNTGGTFAISLLDQKDAAISGTFGIVSSKDLQLTASKSSISLIGDTVVPSLMQYAITGSILKLSNDSVLLKLSPDTSGGSGGGTGGGTGDPTPPAATDPVFGHWSCTDTVGNPWKVLLSTNATFRIDVVVRGADLWMDGSSAITRGQKGADADAVLTVTSSANPKYNGTELRVNLLAGNGSMTLRRMQPAAAGGGVAESMTCNLK